MTVIVHGVFQNEQLELSPGDDEKIPSEMRFWWEEWIDNQEPVGLPHWKRVPSFVEPAGFVAGCLALMPRATVDGFDVPQPDPDVDY